MASDPITVRIPRPLAYVALMLLVIAAILVASTALNRGPAAARDHADRYLSSLVAGDTRGAWQLLTDRARTIWGSFESFDAAVSAADWTRFEFEIMGTSCDDSLCAVDLSLPNGPESVPVLLYEGPTHYWWGPADALVFSDQFVTGGRPVRTPAEDEIDARIVVIFGLFPWDNTGIT